MNEHIDIRQTPEWKAKLQRIAEEGKQYKKAVKLAPLIEQMEVGWTDRGIKRDIREKLIAVGIKPNDTNIRDLVDEARKECGISDPDRDAPVPIIATPYIWQEVSEIPTRDWLYARRLIRKFVTATVGAGGTIKSKLELTEAIAMVSGETLFGIPVPTQLRVWYYNLEDPLEEIQRHVKAICQHFGIQKIDLNNGLFINSGRDQPLVIAETTREGAVICHPVVDALVDQIIVNNIDVLIVDPFVSCHQITENDNSAIDLVTKEWGRVADRANCGVELVHHVRKGDAEVTVESARGGGSFGDACRMVRVINRMTKEDAEKAGVENERLYFKVFIDKNNLAPPAESADWFKLVSIDLGNTPTGIGGDNIGVVSKWEWPDHMAGVTAGDFDKVAAAMFKGQWRADVQAKDWVGIAVANALTLFLDSKHDKAKVKGLIKAWIKAGRLVEVWGDDEKRNKRKFVEVPDDGTNETMNSKARTQRQKDKGIIDP